MKLDTINATLRNKLRSLQLDLNEWKATATSNAAFAKHQSQIFRLHKLFARVIATLKVEMNASAVSDGDDAFERARELSKKILQGHALWAYFRNKFFLRYSKNLQKYLAAADEFAWTCFKPLSAAAAGNGTAYKVPPLIYLGQDVSPLVYPREWSLASQVVSVNDDVFQTVINSAPFSLVSLPYYQTAHLPETMVLAHEMGHVVEMDLGLSQALDASLDAIPDAKVPPQRKEVWKRCRIEAFADVFGATVGGIAFCRALSTFLARDRDFIVKEEIGKSTKYAYPTCYLRVLLVLEVVRDKDGKLPGDAAAIEAEWREDYGYDHLYQDYEKDLESIVEHFVGQPFAELGGNKSIRDLCGLTASDEQAAAKDAQDMLKFSTTPEATDPRVLFAAATLAYYDDPHEYKQRGVENLVLCKIEEVADNEPRAAINIPASSHQADRQSGAELAKLLGKSAEPTNPSAF